MRSLLGAQQVFIQGLCSYLFSFTLYFYNKTDFFVYVSVSMPSGRWQHAVRSPSTRTFCRTCPNTRPTKTRVSNWSISGFCDCVEVCIHVHMMYTSFSDVMMSARGLIQLFRSLNPQMLHRKDRVSFIELYMNFKTFSKMMICLPICSKMRKKIYFMNI